MWRELRREWAGGLEGVLGAPPRSFFGAAEDWYRPAADAGKWRAAAESVVAGQYDDDVSFEYAAKTQAAVRQKTLETAIPFTQSLRDRDKGFSISSKTVVLSNCRCSASKLAAFLRTIGVLASAAREAESLGIGLAPGRRQRAATNARLAKAGAKSLGKL